ncbi:LysM peptidoglycan-binding domain-containing protein [Anaerocolumna sedimenticola]|uniref:LysM peptidoglycan-binding domain-containing protein n=1 Tax=Anaerocolumna sedimenticola TaxID=2696063 RepID=A0A6P1TGP1_9FIRM|nr:LysM peptidoglycan-binding domain-containing protein [Anaerocolumna sedimenticola]QHQ59593.1 LysM peptidoglycan-binding domain-containing protein [Anaerocolumna sedimenticola]
MYIHIIQPTDNIDSIAKYYGVSVTSLIQNNGLINPYDLVPGQTIVIVYPEQTHMVRDGDSLAEIAAAYGVPLIQLLRNNPYLSEREYIYPGEIIVINYNTDKKIATNAFAYPYINIDTLKKTLPYLTYISVYNFRATGQGGIISYYDDSEIIKMAKDYGTIPLMLLTTLTTQGEPNIKIAFDILTNEEYQERFIQDMLSIIKTKGYYGINLFYNYMTNANREIYERFSAKLADSLSKEGYLLFVTVNPNIKLGETEIKSEIVNYSVISQPVNNITFLNLIWGTNDGPPVPVISVNTAKQFLDFIIPGVSQDRIDIGLPIIGYDWTLPYIAGQTEANALTINAAITLADDTGAVIQYDDTSETPFFLYNQYNNDLQTMHITRFIDARTINSLLDLITAYGLNGIGVWNIMIFYDQLWLMINTQYEIEKLIPDNL